MNNSITNRQIFFILFVALTAFTIIDLPKIMAQSAGYGTWFTLLLAAVIFGFSAIIIVRLNQKFPGETIFEYGKRLIGKKATYGLSFYFILYFALVVLNMMVQLTSLVKNDFLFKTPQWLCILAALSILGFIAYKGITNMARLAEIFGLFHLFAGIIIHTTMLFQAIPENILPLFNPAETGKYLAALKDTIYPFVGMELLLIIPFTSNNGKKASKIAFLTIIIAGLYYILIAESCIMKIGMNEIVHYHNSLIIADREIELPFLDFLKRPDIFYLTVGLWAALVGASVFYTATVEYICRAFKRLSRLIAVLIVGIVLFISALIALGIDDFSKSVIDWFAYLAPVSIFLIPCTLLIIAKIKEKRPYR